MKRALIILSLLFFVTALSQAQTTNVTLQVTDAGAQTWNNGTWAVVLVSPPGSSTYGPPFFNAGTATPVPNQSQSGTLGATGASGTITLTQNAGISPFGTQWKFTVCPQATSSCFIQLVTITATTTVTLTPPVIAVGCGPSIAAYADAEVSCGIGGQYYNLTSATSRVCQAATGSTCTTWAAGGGITSGNVLPATCTAGQTFSVTLPWPAGGIYVCRIGALGTGIWTPDNPSQTVSPLAYGGKWDLKYTYQITTVASNATITCTAPDCNFTSTDLTKNFFSYQSPFAAQCSSFNCSASTAYQTLVSATTITAVNGAQSINVASSGAVLASYTPTVNLLGIGVWYTQDDLAALNSAATAAWGTPGFCYALQLPQGAAAISGPALNILASALSYPCGGFITTSGLSGVDISQQGPQVFGQGAWQSMLVPTPAYNYPGCTFGASGHGCNFTTPNLSVINVAVNGMGQGIVSGNPTVNLAEFNGSTAGGSCTGSTVQNFAIVNWAVADANATGLDLGRNACGDPVYLNATSEMAGGINCVFNSAGTVVTISQPACFGGNPVVQIATQANVTAGIGPGTLNTYSGYFAQSNGGAIVRVTTGGGIWNSKGDFIACAFGNQACGALTQLNGVAAGVVNLDGDTISTSPTATGGQAIWVQGIAGNQMHVKNSTIISNGTASLLQNTVAGTKYYDEGGNTYTNGGTTKSTFTGLMIADGHSLKGTCTGVATASSTLGLYGSGPNVTLTTCTSAAIGAGIPMTGARTLTFLIVSATAAGVNASSGAVTVLKNGGATTMTCTIGTGTSCVDDQHQISVADGDLISIQFTTQAAETLAGVKGLVVWSN